MENIILSKKIDSILNNLDFNRLKDNVGIKVHFGEKGCTTYMNPQIVKMVYDKVISLNKKASLIETNVLYKGSRTTKIDHLKTANDHGFDFAPIDIIDGEMGEDQIIISIDETNAKIGGGIKRYDSLIIISHFKGHILAGYGASIKNIGMGFGARSGKLHMHSSVAPSINPDKCTGCKLCQNGCDFKAIDIINKKAVINANCTGCSMCIAICPYSAPKVPWGGRASEDVQKKIVEYTKAVFKIIPKEKCIFINILENITKDCDCMNFPQSAIVDDIGIIAGYNPVALDMCGLNLLKEKYANKFENINTVNNKTIINYAEKLNIGKKDYNLINIDM